MKPPEDRPAPAETPANDTNEPTGLPGLRTWRGVYLFVLGSFVLWLLLLLALTMIYS